MYQCERKLVQVWTGQTSLSLVMVAMETLSQLLLQEAKKYLSPIMGFKLKHPLR